MTDFEHILPLWRELEAAGAEYVLATVAAVQGSSYRKPGARMLLAQDGRRAGTVSGGCLEAEVARRAWWLTVNGPVVERYSTQEDDGDLPYGSGCGGVVYILLERRATAGPLLMAMEGAFHAREPLAIATVMEGPRIGVRTIAGSSKAPHEFGEEGSGWEMDLRRFAEEALEQRAFLESELTLDGVRTRVWADYRAARPGLWIFGAGDDAKPLSNLARELGWFVAVADGRAHLATATRFARVNDLRVLPIAEFPDAASDYLDIHATDAAVLMTHSFEQDARILAALLAHENPLAYIGVLGPQRRTRELLAEAARLLGLEPSAERVERWLEQIYAPIGLDLGAETPATIALSILAEVQKMLSVSTALPLREVRAVRVPAAQI
jgi:xanthine/CO dehydrogenase XdhC/CoxF family maturation factor